MNSRLEPKTTRCQDTTAENELRDEISGAMLNIPDILDALPFYVLIVDSDHRIILTNKAMQIRLRKESNDIIGKYYPKVMQELNDPWDIFPLPLEEAIEKDKAIERKVLNQKSGRWISSAVYPIRRSSQNDRRVFLHVVADITDRRRAHKQGNR